MIVTFDILSLCPPGERWLPARLREPQHRPAGHGGHLHPGQYPSIYIYSLHLSSICIYLSSYIYYLYPCPGGHEGRVAARHHLRPHRAVQAVQGRGAAAALPLHQVSVTRHVWSRVTCHTCLLLSRVTRVSGRRPSGTSWRRPSAAWCCSATGRATCPATGRSSRYI